MRPRTCRFDNRTIKHHMDARCSTMGTRRMDSPWCGTATWRALGVSRARMGRLLGLGPGGKWVPFAMAHGHSTHSQFDDVASLRSVKEDINLARNYYVRTV